MLLCASLGTTLRAVVACFVLVVVVAALPTGDGLTCPKLCFCNSPSRIVYCSRRGLAAIPTGVPVDSLQLNLNGNAFESPVMRRVNLSAFVDLEHLYLSECSLEALEIGAFADLIALRWLDLSNNRLRAIQPDTFHGLQLQHLFLNGNRHIQLFARSFAGLVTVGLYVHDCSLTDISADLLAPLNTTLRYLWLNGNELDRLDSQLAESFAPLHHLRLGSNPLRCDCGAAWLRSFFDLHENAFRGALPPSCFRPPRLRGRLLGDVDPADLRCRPPSFTALEVRFDAPAALPGARVPRRRLHCAAVGDPSPTLYWIQPSGKTTMYERPTNDGDDVEQVDALLELLSDDDDDSSVAGLYTCIANNDVGNVTMTVVIPSQRRPPPVLRRSSHQPVASTPPGAGDVARRVSSTAVPTTTPAGLQSILLGDSLLQLQRLAASNAPPPPPYEWIGPNRNRSSTVDVSQHEHLVPVASSRARFSSAEMACAVVVTHIATLLFCVAVVVVLRGRRRFRLASLSAKTRHRQRRFSLPGDTGGGGGGGVLRAAYERRLPWSGAGSGRRAADYERDEKAVMSLDRATSGTNSETVSFKRGVRQYTLNDYFTNPNDVR